MYPATGPWRVTKKIDSGLYRIRHCLGESRTDKKHGYQLSVYPEQLVPFEPVDRSYNRFGQINVPIGKTYSEEANIRRFEPTKPFKVPTNYSHV